jgi:hypothetical protein
VNEKTSRVDMVEYQVPVPAVVAYDGSQNTLALVVWRTLRDSGERICFTICLFISPDLDGHRAPQLRH